MKVVAPSSCALLGLLAACGGPEVGPACSAYLDCASAAGLGAQAELAYGLDSACWESDETAAMCEVGCADALAGSEAAYPLVEACDGGDGASAAEAFAVASSWTYALQDLEATPPCDDITTAEGRWSMDPASGAAFTLEGNLRTVAMNYHWSAACEVEWGGFTCDTADAGYGAMVTASATFSPDMLASEGTAVIDDVDQDPGTGEDVPCTYTLTLDGTVGG